MGIAKVNNVAGSAVAKVNGVTVSSIAKVNDVEAAAAATATRWVMVHDDRRVSYISNTDMLAGNNWTDIADAFAGGSAPLPSAGNDHINIAYGKDGSGSPMWVASYATDSKEIAYTSDPTATPWTGQNNLADGSSIPGRRFALLWGNNVWVGVGKMGAKKIIKSANGSTWDGVDLSGVTGITTANIYAVTSNGTGTWWIAQENRIYQSTDNAASWSLLHTLLNSSDADPGDIRALAYTNNTLVAGVDASTATIYSASTSDLTDWSNETELTSSAYAFDNQPHIAAAGGRCVVVGQLLKWTFDVSGKTITMDENGVDFSSTSHGNLTGVATDGSTWVACTFSGDTFFSTNGGDTWSDGEQNVNSKDALEVAPDVYLPL